MKPFLFKDLNNTDDNFQKFWTSFKAWSEKSSNIERYFKDEFIAYDNWNRGTYYTDIDYEEEYRLKHGKPFTIDFTTSQQSIDDVIEYIETMYERWIKEDSHYKFTIEVNRMFDEFKQPYRLSSGIVISNEYSTTEHVDEKINYVMFESKIEYAKKQILSNNLNDKKSALKTVVDALQYYLSLFDGKDKYKLAAKLVCNNMESYIYKAVEKELHEIMAMANNYFDIRHNEKKNNNKKEREPLTDSQFIEYLFNRINALLFLLRLKRNNANMIED